jgi:hypothetical protein
MDQAYTEGLAEAKRPPDFYQAVRAFQYDANRPPYL